MPKEAKLENAAVGYARDRGILTYKFVSPSNRGVPDRLFIFPGGICLYVEFKAPGRKPDPIQVRTMARMKAHGCFVCYLDSMAGVIDLFDRLLELKIEVVERVIPQTP